MSPWPGNAGKERTSFGGLLRGDLMSRIRSVGNETTEKRLAALLRQNRVSGWRRHFNIPGKPDFVWPQSQLAVFVDGCFWHGHECGRNLTPKTNARAWREKIARNKARDRRITRRLRRCGWKVIRIWECRLVKNDDRCLQRILKVLSATRDFGRIPIQKPSA